MGGVSTQAVVVLLERVEEVVQRYGGTGSTPTCGHMIDINVSEAT